MCMFLQSIKLMFIVRLLYIQRAAIYYPTLKKFILQMLGASHPAVQGETLYSKQHEFSRPLLCRVYIQPTSQ